MLIDPVWAERASPFSFVGPKRVNPPGIAFDDLPEIDAVLVTHNHYDHMDVEHDRPAVAALPPAHRHAARQRYHPEGDVPGLRPTPSTGTRRSISATAWSCTPSRRMHWSARGTGDRMHALWASFVLRGRGEEDLLRRRHRLRQRRHLPPRAPAPSELALALLPIGAYEPRWFMRNNHMNPDEAVQALELSGAARAFGHHWGTFHLTNEAVEQPAIDLAAASPSVASRRSASPR